jgi:hypothetical protein
MADQFSFAHGVNANGTFITISVQLGAQSGLVHDSVGLEASYWRAGGLKVPIALAPLAALDSLWTEGGFKEKSAGGVPAIYRLDVPHDAFVEGVPWVEIEVNYNNGDSFHVERIPITGELRLQDVFSALSLNLNTILQRIGFVDGVAPETIIDHLRAMMSQDAATPSGLGTFSPQQVSLQALAGRFGFGAGLFPLIVTVKDDNGPLGGVIVTVRNALTGSPKGYGRTNEDGTLTFALDNGFYQVLVATSAAYEPAPIEAIEINNAPSDVLITLVSHPISPPDSEDECMVVCRVISTDGSPKNGVQFTFTQLAVNKTFVGPDTLVSLDVLTKESVEGLMEMSLLRSDVLEAAVGVSTQWRIQCGPLSIDVTRTLDTANFDLGAFLHP